MIKDKGSDFYAFIRALQPGDSVTIRLHPDDSPSLHGAGCGEFQSERTPCGPTCLDAWEVLTDRMFQLAHAVGLVNRFVAGAMQFRDLELGEPRFFDEDGKELSRITEFARDHDAIDLNIPNGSDDDTDGYSPELNDELQRLVAIAYPVKNKDP